MAQRPPASVAPSPSVAPAAPPVENFQPGDLQPKALGDQDQPAQDEVAQTVVAQEAEAAAKKKRVRPASWIHEHCVRDGDTLVCIVLVPKIFDGTVVKAPCNAR